MGKALRKREPIFGRGWFCVAQQKGPVELSVWSVSGRKLS